MRSMRQAILASILVGGASLVGGVPSARAQGTGPGGSLGGYGAMTDGSGSSMGGGPAAGMGGSTVAAFGGRFGAEMPSGGMGAGGLSFRARPSATMSSTRTAFTIGPMGGGMSGGMGQGSGRRPFVLSDPGSSGGLSLGGMRRQMPAASRMGVMPPNFGSPFRQPPSLLAPSSPGAGMSM